MDVNKIIATAESMPAAPPISELTMPADLVGYEDENDPTVKGGWQITSLASADWCLSRLAECDAEAEEIERQAQAAIDRIRHRADSLKARSARGVAYFTYKLAEWAERHRGEILKGKAKSRPFVHGLIGWRKVGGRLVVKDKEALAAWLATQPPESCLYRLKYEPEMDAIQTAFKADGVIPPGMEHESEDDRFYVKSEAPEKALAKKEE